jgi:hypothetical protein
MPDRVLSTEQAKTTLTQMKSALDGGLREEITKLKQYGTTLSDPNIWDGQTAAEFREQVWPSAVKSFDGMLAALEELRTKVAQVHDNIMHAGGNQ